MGVTIGNEAVKASTAATINEFPDRELLGEDVIWSGDEKVGFLSSHRILTKATHSRDGQFGRATGKPWVVRVIADCAAKADTIYDEWLVRDYGGIVRQLGVHPSDFAQMLIDDEGGPENAARPFSPAIDVAGDYQGAGNDNEWGQRYADTLTRIMSSDFNHILEEYDRAAIGEYAGAETSFGHEEMVKFWVGLRSSFPSATFKIHHQIGNETPMMPPRAAIRWSLDGVHEWGCATRNTGLGGCGVSLRFMMK